MDLSLKLRRTRENRIPSDVLQKDQPRQQPPSYHSLPVPPWNAYALGYQANTPTNEDSHLIGENKGNYNSNKGIATQLAPEEFSLDDVRHLQKLIRDLHAENIQKTLSYIQLEQAYYCLKDEVTDLKRLKVKQKEEAEGQARASSNMKFDEAGKEELLKESDELKKTFEVLEHEETYLSGPSNAGERRLENFHAIMNNNVILAENTRLLDAMMQKVQALETELAVWKERNKDREELHEEKSSTNAEKQTDVDIPQRPSILKNRHLDICLTLDEERSPHRGRQDNGQSHTFIYKYLAPKTNSCFSCLKAVLCRCPKAPLQAHVRKTD
ncbi:uncharacterized protein LOC130687481 [Daphnia carinata]|uniref:uncharacterized protein LOC130687481 n=1 Tax=Daphnia carinata TaxID=120202 RepID=UPI00257E407B|nr:uncharacterized protein LOC130687481 [Daphnia carinata]